MRMPLGEARTLQFPLGLPTPHTVTLVLVPSPALLRFTLPSWPVLASGSGDTVWNKIYILVLVYRLAGRQTLIQ